MKYIKIGSSRLIDSRTVVGIFDLDITSQSHITRKYLSEAEKAGQVTNAADDLPKSFVVCEEKGKRTVYLSQAATATLQKRTVKTAAAGLRTSLEDTNGR